MKECSKSIQRRLTDSNFLRCYFVGNGLDIGGKPDPLVLYKDLFPLITEVRTWDWEDGDAQFLAGVSESSYDFIHSSHCLEHLVDPRQGLLHWLRVIREGGHLVITIPDEDMYEQGIFPSTFNRDHKWTFTIYKSKSWSSSSINIFDLLKDLGPQAEVIKIEQINSTYRFNLPRYDQTLSPIAESSIEMIIRKRPQHEINSGGLKKPNLQQPQKEIRIHLNQYKDDMGRMKLNNNQRPPFSNDADL